MNVVTSVQAAATVAWGKQPPAEASGPVEVRPSGSREARIDVVGVGRPVSPEHQAFGEVWGLCERAVAVEMDGPPVARPGEAAVETTLNV